MEKRKNTGPGKYFLYHFWFYYFCSRLKKIIHITLFALLVSAVQAQIVNIENQRLKDKKEGWTGSFDLSFSLIKNTQQVVQFNNHNRLMWKKQQHSVLGITDFSFVKAGKQDFVNSGFQHGRYAWNLKNHPKLFLEGFQQVQYNKVQYIDLRLLAGGGSRAIVLDKDSISINIGAFVMAEHEEEVGGRINQHIRYSCFLSFDFQFNKTTGFNTITYYQPDFLSPSDYRISHESSLRFNVTRHLKFRIAYNLNHDTNPPVGAPKTFYGIMNVFRYEL